MRPKILAVDDEPDILFLLRASLEDEGFDVLTTTSTRQFWEMNSQNNIDVYLIDLTLRDGNGFSIVKELRQTTNRGIIILTGRTGETDHVLGLEIGADDYVTKPFRVRELGARVNAVYRRTSRAQYSENAEAGSPALDPGIDFEFDGYKLSVAARRLFGRDGAEVYLTTAEFDLLVALLNRRGKVMDRDQLMNAIKGRDWESYDRAIDGLVSRLRRKIPARDNGSHLIRTIHGIGYTLLA